MNEHHWGIKGWKPAWSESAQSLSRAPSQLEIVGRSLDSVWTLWEDGDWFEDAPVVLILGKWQLELCSNQIGLFSATRNSIDLESPVAWCQEPNGTGNLTWRENAHSEFESLLGKQITETGVVEYSLGKKIKSTLNRNWVLSGVYFSFGRSHIEIFNALDCNGIAKNRHHVENLRYLANEV